MRVNTAKSIALAERVHREFGSWDNARKTAVLRDGVYVLRSKEAPDEAMAGKGPEAETSR
jgi:hypothetical protein